MAYFISMRLKEFGKVPVEPALSALAAVRDSGTDPVAAGVAVRSTGVPKLPFRLAHSNHAPSAPPSSGITPPPNLSPALQTRLAQNHRRGSRGL